MIKQNSKRFDDMCVKSKIEQSQSSTGRGVLKGDAIPLDIRFGPSGNSASFYEQGHKSTTEAPKWLAALGLDAFEYSFGRGVRISEQAAGAIGLRMKEYGIELSVHAPYYINLASSDPKIVEKTKEHFLKSAQACAWMGGKRVVFHPGAAGKDRKESYLRIAASLKEIALMLSDHGYADIVLCPETMGKVNQIGDLEETTDLCELGDNFIPCVDFGHLYARSLGNFGSEEDYAAVLDKLASALGEERASLLHIHFSKIEFGKSGEKRHLDYEDAGFGPDFRPLAKQLVLRRFTPVLISESKTKMAEDSLIYQQIFRSIEKEFKA